VVSLQQGGRRARSECRLNVKGADQDGFATRLRSGELFLTRNFGLLSRLPGRLRFLVVIINE